MSSRPARALVVAAAGALSLVAAQPAAAIPGLELRQQDSLENRDEPYKAAVARCPERKLVVGGGAKVLDGARTRVGLSTLRPGRPPVGTSRGGTFLAVAEAVNGTRPYDWTLRTARHLPRGGLTDGGPVWLKKVEPHADLMGVDVALTGALDPSIGGMVAHQTCAW